MTDSDMYEYICLAKNLSHYSLHTGKRVKAATLTDRNVSKKKAETQGDYFLPRRHLNDSSMGMEISPLFEKYLFYDLPDFDDTPFKR